MAALFGYMSFAAGSTADELETIFTDNILKAPYHKEGTVDTTPIVIYISLFGMCLVVGIATPFTVLPSKDSIEEIRNKNEGLMIEMTDLVKKTASTGDKDFALEK